ncbi:hypothetical protein JNO63_06860 [Anaerococcus sp. mt242]|uniref:hypothetical protein n=1 Tax=Anaerococcus sp. mt242 TaxID=2661917 RepID=UPI0019342A1C|nr:hypothetical protein [Anaerococcus sp. mt242]MBM0046809.1 hypothetical protein [Anaerococcus sp. mt242]
MTVYELKELLLEFDDDQELKAIVNLDNEYVLYIKGIAAIEDDDRAFLIIEENLEQL